MPRCCGRPASRDRRHQRPHRSRRFPRSRRFERTRRSQRADLAASAAAFLAPGLQLHRWTDRAVIGVAVAAFAAGFGQFGLVAALGDGPTTSGT